MAIQVVNKHTHTPTPYDIYIGRGSALGNPYPLPKYSRDESIKMYDTELSLCLATKDNTLNLNYQGVIQLLNLIWWYNHMEGQCNLVCYCAPLKCHGDIIKKIVEAIPTKRPTDREAA